MEQPNQVWCADITYLQMLKGFLLLVANKERFTRKVLAWHISNMLEAGLCVEALNENIHRLGTPEILDTDQMAQLTSFVWTGPLKRIGTRISMDDKGRCINNVFIERLLRSLKYGLKRGLDPLADRLMHCLRREAVARAPAKPASQRTSVSKTSSIIVHRSASFRP